MDTPLPGSDVRLIAFRGALLLSHLHWDQTHAAAPVRVFAAHDGMVVNLS